MLCIRRTEPRPPKAFSAIFGSLNVLRTIEPGAFSDGKARTVFQKARSSAEK